MAYNRKIIKNLYQTTLKKEQVAIRGQVNIETNKILTEFQRLENDKLNISDYNNNLDDAVNNILNTSFYANIVPSVTNNYDLGSNTNTFKSLYLGTSFNIGSHTLTPTVSNINFSGAINVQGSIVSTSSIQGTELSLTSGGITFEGSTNDSAETTLTVTNPTTDRTITLPNATGTVVLKDTTDILTNKTLTNPNISTIINTGTLTLPTSTDVLIGRSTTDTLLNKSINLNNNTITGTLAEFNTSLSDDNFVSLTGNETLTNKSLTSPIINNSLLTNSNSFDLINTTVATVNFARSSTNLSIGSTTGTTTVNNTLSDSKGEVRTIPQVVKELSYTLQSSDHGKHISTIAGITVNTGIFTVGQNVTIFNSSGASITITQGTGVTIYFAGTANTGSRTVAQKGIVTLLCVGTNQFVINGGGLS